MNKPIIITYDLCGEDKDYDSLISAIKKYDSWYRVTESTWIIFTSSKCLDVRDTLKEYLDSDDRLFVAELAGTAAWSNIRCKSDKLKTDLEEYLNNKKN